METQNTPSLKNLALQFGFILGLSVILFSALSIVIDPFENKWLGTVVFLLSLAANVGVVIFAINSYKNRNNGLISLGTGFKLGALIALVAGGMNAVYNFVFARFIMPERMEKAIEMARKQALIKNPDMSDEELEMAMKFVKIFSSPEVSSIMALVVAAIGGLTVAIVVAAIMQKKPKEIV